MSHLHGAASTSPNGIGIHNSIGYVECVGNHSAHDRGLSIEECGERFVSRWKYNAESSGKHEQPSNEEIQKELDPSRVPSGSGIPGNTTTPPINSSGTGIPCRAARARPN